MTVVQPSSGEMPDIPDGLYPAKIVKVKEVTLEQPDQFGKTEKIEISIDIDIDGEIETLDPRLNRSWSEKATLFKVAQAAGLDPDPYEPFDTDQLLNKSLRVTVKQEEGKWPRVTEWMKASQPRRRGEPQAQSNCKHPNAQFDPEGRQFICRDCGARWDDDN